MNPKRSSIVAAIIAAWFLAASAGAANLAVNSTADDGTGTCTPGKCTLRDAILSAASNDTVVFSLPPNSVITLTNGELLINKSLTISGPGAGLLTVRRSAAAGTPQFRIFEIAGDSAVNISRLTISNGHVPTADGGAILVSSSTLAVFTECTIIDNFAANGGGIANRSDYFFILDSTISGNTTATGGAGGGIVNFGTATVRYSTLSGNAASSGGGIANVAGHLSAQVNTISGNSSDVNGGGISGTGTVILTSNTISGNASLSGGGIYRYGAPATAITGRSNIIALNTAATGPDVFGPFASGGFNLIGNGKDGIITNPTNDQIGTPVSPINPLLGALRDNGGPTWTHALLAGSPAIDKGSITYSTDQRGFARRIDSPLITNAADGSDIGAYEVQPNELIGCSEVNLVVNNNTDGGAGSLRAVLATACGGSTITFASNVRGAISLTSGELLISRNLTITGPGANLLSVQRSSAPGTPNFRIFNNAANNTASIFGLTIANGNTPSQRGGGIFNSGELVLTSCVVTGNSASVGGNGGGIYNDFGTVTIDSSTVSGNTVSHNVLGGSGGGLFNQGGSVGIFSSTISGNSAIGPGGATDSGGGIFNTVGTTDIVDSTITGNSGDLGGGIRNLNGGSIRIQNTIIALNASASGPDMNGSLNSFGFNLIGNDAGASIPTRQPSDLVGVTSAQLNLGPLQNNGGPTPTHALLPGSAAIDKGSPFNTSADALDQRGFTRTVDLPNIDNAPGGKGGDIGAFEVQAAPAAATVNVVEFHHASLDHYFISWIADEIAKLDAGTVIKGWTRTGKTFKTYTTAQPGTASAGARLKTDAAAQAGTSPVCRYYVPPGLGDSHFFGRGITECDATGQKNPSFVLEDPAFMQMFLPVGGTCPANTVQIYRVFSNRPDANHRYMTDKAVRDQMVGAGWLAEGDGPDLVVMCAPQ